MKQCEWLPLLCFHTCIIFPPCLTQRGVNRLARYMWEHLPSSDTLPSPTPNGPWGNFIIYRYWRGLSIIIPQPPLSITTQSGRADWIPVASISDNSRGPPCEKFTDPAPGTMWRQFGTVVQRERNVQWGDGVSDSWERCRHLDMAPISLLNQPLLE